MIRATLRHRVVVPLVAAAIIASGITAKVLPTAHAALPYAGKTLIVGSWGGAWDDSTKKWIGQEFTKETGAKISILDGESSNQYTRLLANSNNPPFDVSWIDFDVAAPAAGHGVLLKLDPAHIPNMKSLYPHEVFLNGEGVAANFGAITILYDKTKIKKVTSWNQLWDAKYKGKISISDPSTGWGLQLLLTAAKLTHSTYSNMAPAWKKIAALAKNASMVSGDYALHQVFQRHEVVMGTAFGGEAYVMHQQHINNVAMAKPREGMVEIPNLLVIPTHSHNIPLAEKFVNIALSPHAQLGFAKDYASAPTNRTVKVPASLSPWMVYGADTKNLIVPDWTKLNLLKQEWINQWNRDIKPLLPH